MDDFRDDLRDDGLARFEAEGASLPPADTEGYVEHDGARIWYASFGAGAAGTPVILLHGGLGHSGNWSNQIGFLVANGHRAMVIDSRGHGRSTRDAKPYSYARMAADVVAVMDALHVDRARFVGWSDGAVIALLVAKEWPARAEAVFFFACNVDPSGTKDPMDESVALGRCFKRHAKDYARLSATPDDFKGFVSAVELMMKTQPNLTAEELRAITVPVHVALSERDEFIRPEHADYLARTLGNGNGTRVVLRGVTHFAPLQRPAVFNEAMLAFLRS